MVWDDVKMKISISTVFRYVFFGVSKVTYSTLKPSRKSSPHPKPSLRIVFVGKKKTCAWMSRWKLGSMVRINGLFHLLIDGVYWGYNPLILTIDPNFQRDIQVCCFWEPFFVGGVSRDENGEVVDLNMCTFFSVFIVFGGGLCTNTSPLQEGAKYTSYF